MSITFSVTVTPQVALVATVGIQGPPGALVLPELPDQVNDYALASIGGVLSWRLLTLVDGVTGIRYNPIVMSGEIGLEEL